MSKKEPKKGELAYYITLFKIEGHETWRAHLAGHKSAFREEIERNKNGQFPQITQQKIYRIDRISGEIHREV